MIRVPYISTYTLGLKRAWDTRLCFSRPSGHGGGAGEVVLLAATVVCSCEASTVLEEPLGRSGKKLLGERKIEPTSMRGASDDLSPVSIHGAICTSIGVVGRFLVMG